MVTPHPNRDHSQDSSGNSTIHPVELPEDDLLKETDVRKTKRSGPGGQHRNKVETAIVLTHRPTGIQVEASERRSQSENQKVAIERLRMKLAVHFRTPVDTTSAPSELWRTRCRGGKIIISPSHADFPRLLAEALNHIAEAGWELKSVAERMGCSASQLLKLIKEEPTAWTQLLEERRRLGLRDLK